MSSIEVKSFNNPDEVNTNFNNAKMESVNVGGERLIRITLHPGWKWSSDVKPVVQTDSCQTKHLGIITAGSVLQTQRWHRSNLYKRRCLFN